jgi:hypothetical protein
MDYKKLSDDLAKLLDARGMVSSVNGFCICLFVCLIRRLFVTFFNFLFVPLLVGWCVCLFINFC